LFDALMALVIDESRRQWGRNEERAAIRLAARRQVLLLLLSQSRFLP